MRNRERFLVRKDCVFCREVVEHYLLKHKPNLKLNIQSEIDKWIDYHNSKEFEKMLGRDIFNISHYHIGLNNMVDDYLCDKGCDKNGVGECVKMLCGAFGKYASEIYELYKNNKLVYVSVEDIGPCIYSKRLQELRLLCFFQICSVIKSGCNIDESYAINAIKLFEKRFAWFDNYYFYSKWAMVFAISLFELSDIITIKNYISGKENCETKFQQQARDFLEKRFYLNNQGTNFFEKLVNLYKEMNVF